MGRGRHRRGSRVAVAAFVAVASAVATAISGAAATFNFTAGTIPSAPLHVAVGDVITLSLPPAPPPPAGEIFAASPEQALPSSSDSAVLQRTSAGYDAQENAIATFQAERAGTAAIHFTITASYTSAAPECNTTSSTATASTTSTTRSTTSTTTTTSPAPSPQCSGSSSISTGGMTVVVDAGVQGAATTVPAAGAASVPWPGVGLLVAGMVAVFVVTGRHDTRKRP